LREIKAAKPDFLLIDGDFVDEGSPEDLALAKRILDEELGGELPYYYVPGNHEIMGGKIDNFKAAFGDAYRVFDHFPRVPGGADHTGTRFITLDTSTLTLRGGGFDQIEMLRAALDSAATDPAIGSVVVVEHVPPRDPTPAKASQLNDRKEAALLEQWLAEFQRSTGKGALFIGGHVGLFNASRVDGVPYFINGNSGKTPAAAPADGGFWGWTMFGVDPVSAREAVRARCDPEAGPPRWVRAETRVRVDALALDAPPSVAIGAPATVTATVTQGGREVPVRFPVSADWSASPGVYIGDRAGVRPWHTAWFDPGTGRLTALRPSGSVILAVTVNGVTARATVALGPGATRPASGRAGRKEA
jgi:3',5'-cyclic AMP phosphodiesterase CpdA